MLHPKNAEYKNGAIAANARQIATNGRYHIHAKPMTRRLIDIDTDIATESMAIIELSNDEFSINIFNILARHDAEIKIINQPTSLKLFE